MKNAKIEIHSQAKRGATELEWLESRHSFSFGDYYDPARMGFGALHVLNDDIIAPGMGFGMHPHNNMEIISIVLKGALEHKDSEGNHGIIPAGDVQKMSAGTGIRHSEFNPSKKDAAHLLQIWISPKEKNIKPAYEQKSFSPSERKNRLAPIVLPEKTKDTIYIHQDAALYLGSLNAAKEISYKLMDKAHGVYLFVIDGEVSIDGKKVGKRDAAAVTAAASLTLSAVENAEVLLIEIPLK